MYNTAKKQSDFELKKKIIKYYDARLFQYCLYVLQKIFHCDSAMNYYKLLIENKSQVPVEFP